jgi:hypothetical protein
MKKLHFPYFVFSVTKGYGLLLPHTCWIFCILNFKALIKILEIQSFQSCLPLGPVGQKGRHWLEKNLEQNILHHCPFKEMKTTAASTPSRPLLFLSPYHLPFPPLFYSPAPLPPLQLVGSGKSVKILKHFQEIKSKGKITWAKQKKLRPSTYWNTADLGYKQFLCLSKISYGRIMRNQELVTRR